MSEFVLVLMMFWNVENYFDPFDNPLKEDDEFTPRGEKHWTWKKFEKKRDDISKTIMLIKDEYGIFPAVIGMCEVENYLTLKQLTQNTPLAKIGYRILIKESRDRRGINTALLYNPHIYTNLKVQYIPIINDKDTLQTRDILYSKGVINNLDTVHIFVNHFPSKVSGAKPSQKNRMATANVLKSKTDSLQAQNPNANIILMGDFNDGYNSAPLKIFDRFINLSKFTKKHINIKGTYKFKADWEIIDHFLISDAMLKDSISSGNKDIASYKWLYANLEDMDIFRHKILLIPDTKFNGFKLNRTFLGPRYLAGVSDHLPIILKLYNEIPPKE